jgi:chlorite dismutase
MRAVSLVIGVLLIQVNLVTPGWASNSHVYGTFVLFEVDQEWKTLSLERNRKGVQEVKTLVDTIGKDVEINVYWTYGLTNNSHFMLRLHAADLHLNQRFLTEFQRTALGRHLTLVYTVSGVTKALNYAPDFPDLLEQLKSAQYEGEPPRYAAMIPIRKSAAWWNLPKEERVVMMREHTVPTLAYLKTITRKLYHATGLSDVDFLTIFETNDMVAFNDLMIALRMVREDSFNVQLGEPTILGTIRTWSELMDLLTP